MAGFDFFQQINNPMPSVSLFGDAGTQGANLGIAIPSQLGAAITGAIKGFGEGQGFARGQQQATMNQQQIEMNQNTLDQQPSANRIQDAQATNAEAVASINTTKAEIDAANKAVAAQAEAAKLQQEKAVATGNYLSVTHYLEMQLLNGKYLLTQMLKQLLMLILV